MSFLPKICLVTVLIICAAPSCRGEDYNLFGTPGEGYVIELMIGHPGQKLNVLVDTGSSNLAVASSALNGVEHALLPSNSTSLQETYEPVSVVYTQGSWSGELVSDYVYFPTLNSVPEVRCDIALITSSADLFLNGSYWQGILGMAYATLARPDAHVQSWLDALQCANNDRSMAFSLTLCGSPPHKFDHFGSLEVLNNVETPERLLRAPLVQEWFYEVLLHGVRVDGRPLEGHCRDLNKRTIVDSGTTNLRLPHSYFRQVVQILYEKAQTSLVVHDSFWFQGEVACWPTPREWDMPNLTLEVVLSENTYFNIELTPASYMRQVMWQGPGVEQIAFCYKLGLEEAGESAGAVLGVAVLEGMQVIFNRTEGTVGFRETSCGPPVRLSGPHLSAQSEGNLLLECARVHREILTMLQVAAYVAGTVLMMASGLLLWVASQPLRESVMRRLTGFPPHTALIQN